MSLTSVLKRNSKTALGGSWGRAILLMLIVWGLYLFLAVFEQTALNVFAGDRAPVEGGILSAVQGASAAHGLELVVTGIFAVLGTIVLAPVQMGLARWHWMLVNGRSLPTGSVFHFFERPRRYAKCVWLYLQLAVRHLLWAFAFYVLPAAAMGVSLYFMRPGSEITRTTAAVSTVGMMLSIVLAGLATVMYGAYMHKYALAPFLFMEDESCTARGVIKTSIAYTKGYRFSHFLFTLSFGGWVLLGVVTAGLGFLYAGPYLQNAWTMYARYILEKNKFARAEATREFVVE